MNKFIVLVLTGCLGWSVGLDSAHAAPRKARALADVCSDVEELTNDGLWKWKASDHINRADARAKGPSLICSRRNKKCVQWPAKTFNCDGSRVQRGVMYRYGTWNVTGADRGYTNKGNSNKIRRVARQKDCSVIYVQKTKQRSGSSAPACYSVSVRDERSGTPY